MRLRVELFARIRRDARVEGLSIRELSRRHRVSRETVRAALAQAEPSPRKVPVRVSVRLEAFKPAIDAMLVEDTTAPRKQRHTARRCGVSVGAGVKSGAGLNANGCLTAPAAST